MEKEMPLISKTRNSKIFSTASAIIIVAAITLLPTSSVFAGNRSETIEAQAYGTSTQMGQNVGVSLNIYSFSTPADRVALIEAFQKGQNQGLVNALQKMKAVGHVEVTGTLGYDCAYIAMTPTPTGRRIVFVTNRLLRFGEVYYDTRSASYDLTAGVIELNEQDKSKSTGTLYPAAELVINKQNQIEWDLNRNPWRLSDIIDWPGTAGVN
jgi:hypothetical protein